MHANLRKKLAEALERIHAAADRGIVRSADIARSDRELLQQQGYLENIIKGWYLLSTPTASAGESTVWYANFWNFLTVYLESRFGKNYCLSATASMDIHLDIPSIPHQVIVICSKGGKTVLNLPHNTSLLIYEERGDISWEQQTIAGLCVMPLELALCRLPETFFRQRQADAEIALRSLSSITGLVRQLLSGRHIAAAQRLSGAFKHIGDNEAADEITAAMKAAGQSCKPANPFGDTTPFLGHMPRNVSPYAARIATLFNSMKEIVEKETSAMTQSPQSPEQYLKHVDEMYVYDAYHSLSIEGYNVTPQLITRIHTGEWNPEINPDDEQERNAMAAKGYLEAFLLVKKTVSDILTGMSPVDAVKRDYGAWYRALFSSSVQAGILEPHHLAGFRNAPVYIKRSRHVPLPPHAIVDAMDSFFSHLQDISSPAPRAVLGHFVFTFIHPYMDGNGRIARFLMNAMMASGGYPWTIIRVERRKEYMTALETASCNGNIEPFARFILQESSIDWNSIA